jgi:hypothetical protein
MSLLLSICVTALTADQLGARRFPEALWMLYGCVLRFTDRPYWKLAPHVTRKLLKSSFSSNTSFFLSLALDSCYIGYQLIEFRPSARRPPSIID